ncbi:MAG: hypothetical protein PHV16_05210 [Candidatus Nanoarchaeia archaeon]|nr:hypothetical protein [Candidatus Nanoarchaeia archaeon]
MAKKKTNSELKKDFIMILFVILVAILFLCFRYKIDILVGGDPPPIKVIILILVICIIVVIYFVTNKRLLEVDEFHRKLRMKRLKTISMPFLALLFLTLSHFSQKDGLSFFYIIVAVLILGIWWFHPIFLFKE